MDIWALICFAIITLYVKHIVNKAIDKHNAEVDDEIRSEINKLLLVKIDEVMHNDTKVFLMWDRKTNKFLGQSEVYETLIKDVFELNPSKEEIMIAESNEAGTVITVKDVVKRSEVFN
jgi:hypothetical protein